MLGVTLHKIVDTQMSFIYFFHITFFYLSNYGISEKRRKLCKRCTYMELPYYIVQPENNWEYLFPPVLSQNIHPNIHCSLLTNDNHFRLFDIMAVVYCHLNYNHITIFST